MVTDIQTNKFEINISWPNLKCFTCSYLPIILLLADVNFICCKSACEITSP